MAKKLFDEYKDQGAGDQKKGRILQEFVKRRRRGENPHRHQDGETPAMKAITKTLQEIEAQKKRRDEVYEDGEAENMRKEDKAGKRIIKDEQAEQNGDSTNEGTINKKQPKE